MKYVILCIQVAYLEQYLKINFSPKKISGFKNTRSAILISDG